MDGSGSSYTQKDVIFGIVEMRLLAKQVLKSSNVINCTNEAVRSNSSE